MADAESTGKFRNPGWVSIVTFVAMLLVAFSSWGLEHSEHGHWIWDELLTPSHVFSLLGVFGSVLVAWLSKSPVKE